MTTTEALSYANITPWTAEARIDAQVEPLGAVSSGVLLLTGKLGEGWRLVQPLTVSYELDEDGWWIFSDDVFLVYGAGATALDAFHDYVVSLLEYYRLIAKGAQTNEYDRVELLRLRRYLMQTGTHAAQT